MTRPTEDRPATVPLAQQAGETPSRWRWVKPSAWTVRMSATLEGGVEGGKYRRWPNAFFAGHGLFNLVTAHALAGRPSLR